ncbi:MAG TPA: DUF962 domain-containing protein [Thermoanaerobaculia bacterium]|nr:DUF962 domain-containing protein [Thermoanaerobaculia bacterium]
MSQSDPRFEAFEEFYAVYLADHRHPVNRALHLLAKLLAIAGIVAAVVERSFLLLLAVPILAVAPCWIGHLLLEGNRPVSWRQPSASLLGTLHGWLRRPLQRRPAQPARGGRAYYSFLADLRMCGEMLARKDSPRFSKEPT